MADHLFVCWYSSFPHGSCCSVAKSCLCDPMNCTTPGFSVHHWTSKSVPILPSLSLPRPQSPRQQTALSSYTGYLELAEERKPISQTWHCARRTGDEQSPPYPAGWLVLVLVPKTQWCCWLAWRREKSFEVSYWQLNALVYKWHNHFCSWLLGWNSFNFTQPWGSREYNPVTCWDLTEREIVSLLHQWLPCPIHCILMLSFSVNFMKQKALVLCSYY